MFYKQHCQLWINWFTVFLIEILYTILHLRLYRVSWKFYRKLSFDHNIQNPLLFKENADILVAKLCQCKEGGMLICWFCLVLELSQRVSLNNGATPFSDYLMIRSTLFSDFYSQTSLYEDIIFKLSYFFDNKKKSIKICTFW